MIERGRGDIERACKAHFAECPVAAEAQTIYVESFSSAIGQLLGGIKAEVTALLPMLRWWEQCPETDRPLLDL